MNTKEDILYKAIMQLIKNQVALTKYSTTVEEREEDLKAINELLTAARNLTSRI